MLCVFVCSLCFTSDIDLPTEFSTHVATKRRQHNMAGSSIRSFLNSVVFVPFIIIVSWQFPVFHGKRVGDVTVVGRACYELFGASAEAQWQPPELLVRFCVRNLPTNVTLATAKDVSSIVTIQRHVIHTLNKIKFYVHGPTPPTGVKRTAWQAYVGVWSWKEIAKLADAANWIRLIPCMFIASPQLRGGFLTLYVTSFFVSVPVPINRLGTACHAVAAFVLMDFVWGILEHERKREIKLRDGKLFIAYPRWRNLKWEAGHIALQVISPIILVLLVSLLMLGVGYVVDSYVGPGMENMGPVPGSA